MTATTDPPTLFDMAESKGMHEDHTSSSLLSWCSMQWRPILSELVSTTMLVLFGCMSCIPIDKVSEQSPLYSPIGFGLTVMFIIQIFGHISGAQMNPALTLANILVIWGSTQFAVGICYMVVQALGATIGYGILMGVAPIDVSANKICVTVPHPGINVFQALVIEIVLTGALSLINCAVCDLVNQHKQDSIPIKFGLAVVGLSVAGGPLTGASMNPARSFGPAIWTGTWKLHWTYWAGPFMGAAGTAIFYKSIYLNEKKPF